MDKLKSSLRIWECLRSLLFAHDITEGVGWGGEKGKALGLFTRFSPVIIVCSTAILYW
jgi:hypothetical protein